MLNQITLVGRIKELGIIKKETEHGFIKIAVSRSFKNKDGEYEADLIPVRIFGNIVENTIKYCSKEDIVGIKGRIQMQEEKIEIIAEKITFLSHKKNQCNQCGKELTEENQGESELALTDNICKDCMEDGYGE